MDDFSDIDSPHKAGEACFQGRLVKVLLLPVELGGQDRQENVSYIPIELQMSWNRAVAELLNVIDLGFRDISIIPEYCGVSLVPARIKISAAASGMPPKYEREIEIW